jgi:hypothetical protein
LELEVNQAKLATQQERDRANVAEQENADLKVKLRELGIDLS